MLCFVVFLPNGECTPLLLKFGLIIRHTLANRMLSNVTQAEAWNVLVSLSLFLSLPPLYNKNIPLTDQWLKKKKTHEADLSPTWHLEPSPAYVGHPSAKMQMHESKDYCFKLMSLIVVCYKTLLLQTQIIFKSLFCYEQWKYRSLL